MEQHNHRQHHKNNSKSCVGLNPPTRCFCHGLETLLSVEYAGVSMVSHAVYQRNTNPIKYRHNPPSFYNPP